MPPQTTDSRNPITRREALRRTVVFSAGALMAGRHVFAKSVPPITRFDSDAMHLLAFGDYGSKGNSSQVAVSKRMAMFAKSLDKPLAAVLALGDSFYTTLTPDRFIKHFERMYSTKYLNCPFYVCPGNHDYGTAAYDYQPGKLQMQLDYAKNHPQSRWKLPSKWYTVTFPSAEKPLVKAIMLDGNYWEGALTPKEKIEQRHFLEAELNKKTDASWLWVVNHFPLYSDCPAYAENKRLISEWGELIKSHPVSLFISGHAHILQHLHVEGYSTSFIVSGAGGQRLYKVKETNRGFVTNHYLGFNHISVTPDEIQVQYINADGDCLHRFRRDQTGKVQVLA
jgi:tartrate-resistant acid phosphatase type 5